MSLHYLSIADLALASRVPRARPGKTTPWKEVWSFGSIIGTSSGEVLLKVFNIVPFCLKFKL